MANLILFHKKLAVEGSVVDQSQKDKLIAEGWVTGPHLFDKKMDVILEEAKQKSANPSRATPEGEDPVIMYHEDQAPIGKIFKKSEVESLLSLGWVDTPEKFTGNSIIDDNVDSVFIDGSDAASAHTLSPKLAKERAKQKAKEKAEELV